MPRHHSHRRHRSDVRALALFLAVAALLQALTVALALRERPRVAPYAAATTCLVLLPPEADECRALARGTSV